MLFGFPPGFFLSLLEVLLLELLLNLSFEFLELLLVGLLDDLLLGDPLILLLGLFSSFGLLFWF